MVEVKGAPKLLPSCYTTVAEGMEVNTQSDVVKDFQRRNMEFILLNHPCPFGLREGGTDMQRYFIAFCQAD